MPETKSINMAAKLPFVSIIIPVYNGGPFFRECLKSIKELEYPKDKLELIVVDNNSTDGSGKLAERMTAWFPFPARVLYETSIQTSYAARNRGINFAEGDLLAFTDADCIADKDWIKNLASHFEDETIGCFAGPIIPYRPKTLVELFSARAGILGQEKFVTENSFQPLPFAATANAAFRRAVFAKIGLFRQELISGGDVDLAWRMQKESRWKIKFVRDAIIYHKHRDSVFGLYRQFYKYAVGHQLLGQLHADYLPIPKDRRRQELIAAAKLIMKTLPANVKRLARREIDAVDFLSPFMEAVICLARYRAHFDPAIVKQTNRTRR